jgi:putative hemolysin
MVDPPPMTAALTQSFSLRHIPDDVWMHIAQSLPRDNLRTLYAVNRAFFDAAMKARYHTVLLRVLDIDTFKLLMRLQ